jgi:hypothetical protein
MKEVRLLIALLGLTMSPLVSANEFSQGEDFSDWIRAELAWNEEHGTYLVVPILKEDPFQERMVYSDYYADYVPYGMALRAAYDYQERIAQDQSMVWSDHYADFVPFSLAFPFTPEGMALGNRLSEFLASAIPNPCKKVRAQAAL